MTRLHERVGNNSTFWKGEEVVDALNEGIAFWQALTGEWTTRVSIEARSPSPSFYPVPKQIVSLTRVGIASEAEALNPLRGHILPNHPVYKTGPDTDDPEIYHTVTDRAINWSFRSGGGVEPYRIIWDFGEGPLPEVEGTYITHTFPTSLDQTDVDVTATVTDTTGDVFTTTFPVEIRNQELEVLSGDGTVISETCSDTVQTAIVEFPLEARYAVNGSSGTELAGNNYLNRYPITFEFDFTPFDTGNPTDGGQVGVTKVELLDALGTVRQSLETPGPLKFFHTAETLWEFSNGWAPPLSDFDGESAKAYGGFYTGLVAAQEITNYTYDINADSTPEVGTVRLYLAFPNGADCPSTTPFNFTVKITDGTGLTISKRIRYFYDIAGV
jgi:hypothetical protein